MSDPNSKIKRRQVFILGGALVTILVLVVAGMFLFETQAPPRREKPKTVKLTPPGTVEDREAWRATQAARARNSEKTISELEQKVRSQMQATDKLTKDLDALKKAKSEAAPTQAPNAPNIGDADASKVLEKPLRVSTNAQRVLSPPTGAKAATSPGTLNKPLNGDSEATAPPREEIEMISFQAGSAGEGPSQKGPTPSARKPDETQQESSKGIQFLPTGSFVRVGMLNGVDAPTGGQAQSNPLAMAFHVLDVANLANRYKLDIKDCRFLAAAWGELSSERTMARTETLTCIINDRVVEMPIKGYVIGEDGKAGIRGRLVTKQGQLLANSLLAGSLGGIARAFQSAATTTTTGGGGVTQTIDPDRVTQAGVGGGISAAANSLAQYYLKAADKLFPIIETDGGRVVEILITKGAVYDGSANARSEHRELLRRNGANRSTEDD